MACLILSLTASLVMWSLYEIPSSFRKHLISVACNFFRMSAVNVQVSQAYNSTEITRKRISLIFELREICLSLQMVLSLASAAVVCAIRDSTSGLEPWSVTTTPRYLKLSTSTNFSPLILMSVLIPFDLFNTGHQFGLLCTDFHAKGCRGLIQVIHQGGSSSSFLPGRQCHQQNVSW